MVNNKGTVYDREHFLILSKKLIVSTYWTGIDDLVIKKIALTITRHDQALTAFIPTP